MKKQREVIEITGVVDGVDITVIKDLLEKAGISKVKIELRPQYDDWLASLPSVSMPGLRDECLDWIRCWCNGGGDQSSKNVITDALDELVSDIPAALANAAFDSVPGYSKSEFEAIGLICKLINDSIDALLFPITKQLTEISQLAYHELKEAFFIFIENYIDDLNAQIGAVDPADAALTNVLVAARQCDKQTQKYVEYFVDEYKRKINPPPSATENMIALLREQYPDGTRVELIKMHDPFSDLLPGDSGTVRGVDDIGSILINWDKGSSLNVLFGVDEVRKI